MSKPRLRSVLREALWERVHLAEQLARNERAERIRQHPNPMRALLLSACADAGTEAAGELLLDGEVDMSEEAMRVRLKKAIDRVLLDLRVSEVN